MLEDEFGLDLMGWTLYEARAISRDGRFIVGNGLNPIGEFEPWLAEIPEPGSGLLSVLGLGSLALLRPQVQLTLPGVGDPLD